MKWTATLLLITIAAAWAFSGYSILFRLWPTAGGGETGVWLTNGRIGITHSDFRQSEDGAETRFMRQNTTAWHWWFSYRDRSPPFKMAICYVPLWVFEAVLLPAVVLMWRHDWRHRFGPGRCRRCGYDLSGLPKAVCPECGPQLARR
ncbi:MAG: hypothetical protein WD749_11965 [Phycisphaerales bacterium]